MDVLTQVFLAITFVVATQGHPPHRMFPVPPFKFDPNMNTFQPQPQNHMYPDVHRGLLEDFFHNLFGRPSFGQNPDNVHNPFNQILPTPASVGSDATHSAEGAKPIIMPDLYPNGSNKDDTHSIIKDGPQNLPDVIHTSNPLQNPPEDLSIEDIEVKPQNPIKNENVAIINEGDENLKDNKSPPESDQVKLSRVVPHESEPSNPISSLQGTAPRINDVGADNGKDKKDPGLSKNSDFLLIPITDDSNSRIVFPDSDLIKPSNIAVDDSTVAVSSLSANSAPTIEVPTPLASADTTILNTGTPQVPVSQPMYQIVNSVPQNQDNLIPFNNIPATTNSQPVYSILNVPNSSGYQGITNQQPMYIIGTNSQPSNVGYSNLIYTWVPLNQPNSYVQPNVVAPSSQPHYIFLNNPSNLPQSNQNVPLNNPNGMQYIILGNQPSNVAPLNQPNNIVSFSNQPQNVVPLNSNPLYVTLGNQPNTYIPVETHTVAPSSANTVVSPSTDPNNVVAFSNPDYNLIPLNTPNVVQTTSPIILNPINNGNVPILISMKDEADDVSNDKKNQTNEKVANNENETVTDSQTNTDSKTEDEMNHSDVIHFPEEQENHVSDKPSLSDD